MKTLRLAGVLLLAFLAIGFASCNKDNNGNNTNDEIIEYQGEYHAPENIKYAEDGVTYEIEAIPGQIIISADVDHNTVVNAVKANGGTIIQQYPQYGDYLVEVVIGSENAFLTAMNKLNITADLNIVEYPKEKYDYFVFDDFIDVNGIQHGKKVSSILSDCQDASVINEINLYTSRIPNWVPLFGGVALNLSRFKFGNLLSQNQVLVNWSNGYGNNDDDWQSMTEEQKQNFTKGWKMSVKLILDKIIWLKRMSPGIDIVFAQAAGNEKCPEMAQMINDLKSNPKYKTILEENMIFVSDYSAFANTSTEYGDFCYIKEHPYFASGPNGGSTSFAAPQALCYINQVIKGTIGEDGKNITAVQALAAVKAAIRQNSNGELDLDEALAMARNMYSPGFFTGTPFDNTSWNVPYTRETTTTGVQRVREVHNNPNGIGVYYTYRNENFSETDSNSGLMTPSFLNSIYYHEKEGDYWIGYEFKGDSIIVKAGFLEEEAYIEGYVNDETCVSTGENYTVKTTYSRYFRNSNSFCLRELIDRTGRESWGENDWYKYHIEKETLITFTINENTNSCSIDYNHTENMNTLEYGSEYTGRLSENSTTIGHGTGTYEYGIKDNVVNQGDDLNDLMFFPEIPMKKHK